MEIALALEVVRGNVPTLAICRGMQIVNVALGGTLHVHLPDVFGDAVLHRAPPREPVSHSVKVVKDSCVADIMQSVSVTSVSWHHQAIRDVAPGLDVVATAPDGVMEAVEMKGHPWLIGVQWHPELTSAADDAQQRLFTCLVHAASALHGRRVS
jgi:putative glutamine amidotransferase